MYRSFSLFKKTIGSNVKRSKEKTKNGTVFLKMLAFEKTNKSFLVYVRRFVNVKVGRF